MEVNKMYSWGSSDTDGWKKGGYQYDDAKKGYMDDLKAQSDAKGGRTYKNRSSPDFTLTTPKKDISTSSENVIAIGIDGTGSMCDWPAEIFDRLSLLYQTLSQYKPDLEISFAAIGDAYSDEYPLQVTKFTKGVELEDEVNALYGEGNGGGQRHETYELYGHYMLNHANVDKATSPFLFIFGDEMHYDTIDKNQVKHYIGDDLESDLDSKDMWQKLGQKFNVFYLQKDYGYGGVTQQAKEQWSDAIGAEKVIDLPDKTRAVDVAMAIVARHWGAYDDFKDNIGARQDASVVNAVEHSVRFIPKDVTDADTGSKLVGDAGGEASKPLI